MPFESIRFIKRISFRDNLNFYSVRNHPDTLRGRVLHTNKTRDVSLRVHEKLLAHEEHFYSGSSALCLRNLVACRLGGNLQELTSKRKTHLADLRRVPACWGNFPFQR